MDSPPSSPTPTASGGAASSGGNASPATSKTPSAPSAVTTPNSKVADSAPAPRDPAAPVSPEKPVRKFKIKVDGGEDEVDLDSLNDERIVKALQMEKVAYKRMQEKAELERKYKMLKEQLKTDAKRALKEDPEIGVDIRKQIEEELIREYKESQMSDEARRAAQLERELQERDAKLKQIETEKAEAARKQLEDRLFQETETQFVQALEMSDLPRTRDTLYMMGQIAQINHRNKIDLTPQQLAAETRQRITQMHQYVTRTMKGEALINHLGEDVVKEVLRHQIKKAQAAKASKIQTPPPQTQTDVTDLSDKPQRKATDPRDARKFFKGLK